MGCIVPVFVDCDGDRGHVDWDFPEIVTTSFYPSRYTVAGGWQNVEFFPWALAALCSCAGVCEE